MFVLLVLLLLVLVRVVDEEKQVVVKECKHDLDAADDEGNK